MPPKLPGNEPPSITSRFALPRDQPSSLSLAPSSLRSRSLQTDSVVMLDEIPDDAPRVLQTERCLDSDAFAFQGLMPPLDVAVALGIIR